MNQAMYKRKTEQADTAAAAAGAVFTFLNERGIKAAWLAEQLGMTPQRLNAIRRGVGVPDDFVVRAALVLDVSAQTLVEWINEAKDGTTATTTTTTAL